MSQPSITPELFVLSGPPPAGAVLLWDWKYTGNGIAADGTLTSSSRLRWSPKTGQVAKRESGLGTAGWPEVRLVEYAEETQS
jgi:hypothetical protein